MLTDITLGQYFSGNSFLHRLDPRVKIISSVVLLIFIFLASNVFSVAFLAVVTVILIGFSRIPLGTFWQTIKMLSFILILSFLFISFGYSEEYTHRLFELNVFDSVMLAEFELFAHDELQKGETLTAEDYNNKFVELSKEYFGNVVFNENYEFNWSRKSHIYRDYYLYKYSLGMCCACSIAKRLLEDKTGEYLKKYKAFLCLGGSKDPISSLKVADVDVCSNDIYDNAFDMFKDYLNELKKLAKEK